MEGERGMEENKEEGGVADQIRTQSPSEAGVGSKGKTCKGCLYYSSIRKSKSQSPICVGLSQTLQQVPSYIVQQSELKSSEKSHNLTDFKHACIGYSVYLDDKDTSTDPQEQQAKLPLCVGIEFLLETKPSHAEHVPSHVYKREDAEPVLQPRTYTSPHSPWNEFTSRFTRSATVVAFGVAKNASRVGNRIKSSLDDILYPRRSK